MVTGANGFVGTHLTNLLTRQGHEVVAIAGPLGDIPPLMHKALVSWIRRDLTIESSVREMVDQNFPDQIYHLAGTALTRGVPYQTYYSTNVFATRYIAKAARELGKRDCKFLYISSGSVYGSVDLHDEPISESTALRPNNDYSVSKAAAELEVWAQVSRGLRGTIARPFNHTGPGQKMGFVCPDIIDRLRTSIRTAQGTGSDVNLDVRGLESVRDFTDVRDVVNAYELIMNNFNPGEVVNVSTGFGLSVRFIVETLCFKVAGLSDVFLNVLDPDADKEKQDVVVGDSSLLRHRTGWKPQFTIYKTLQDMWTMKGTL